MCKLNLFNNKKYSKILELLDHNGRIFNSLIEEIKKMAVNFDAMNAVVTSVKASIDAAVIQLEALETWIKANPNTDPTTTAALQAIQDDLTAKKAELDTAVANGVVPPVV
jgi:hypothetical protein